MRRPDSLPRLRVLALSGQLAAFLVGLMVIDELMIHFSFRATTYEYPILGAMPIWTAWELVFGVVLAVYLLTFVSAMKGAVKE